MIAYAKHAASWTHETLYSFKIKSSTLELQFGVQGLIEEDHEWFIDFDIRFEKD